VIRAKTLIETTASGRERIIVTEIPYQVNKAEMIKKLPISSMKRRLKVLAIFVMSLIVRNAHRL
jgi:DNA gyrase/topoisomerase IV subunit A